MLAAGVVTSQILSKNKSSTVPGQSSPQSSAVLRKRSSNGIHSLPPVAELDLPFSAEEEDEGKVDLEKASSFTGSTTTTTTTTTTTQGVAEDWDVESSVGSTSQEGQEQSPEPCGGQGVCNRVRRNFFHFTVLVVYVMLYGNMTVTRYLSKDPVTDSFPYSVSSMVMVNSIVGIFVGIIMMKLNGEVLAPCLNAWQILAFGPAGILQVLDLLLRLMVLLYLPPTTVTMLQQLSTVSVAFASSYVFSRKFSAIEKMSLVILILVITSYTSYSHTNHDENHQSADFYIGLALQGANLLVATAQTILIEYQMKGNTGSFPEQQVKRNIITVPVVLVYYLLFENLVDHQRFQIPSPSKFFDGWTWITAMACAVVLAEIWVGTYIQKEMDSVVRKVATGATSPLVYLEMSFLAPGSVPPFNAHTCSLLLAVVIAVANYASTTKYTRSKRQAKIETHANR